MPEKTVVTAPSAAEMNSGLVENKKNHYCEECGKSFNSGKALGGHLSSAHVQSRKDYSFNKPNSSIKKHHNSLGLPAGRYCVICGREFLSSKALFGHMRSHPERQWRGMDPPATVESSGDDDCVDLSLSSEVAAPLPEVDIATSLKGWSLTARRGRPGISKPPAAAASIDPLPVKDGEVMDVVGELLKLIKNQSEKENNNEVEDVGSCSLDADNHHFKKQKTEAAIDVAEEKLVKAETKADKTTQENSETSSGQNYLCTKCNRSFPSHQALGGHKSSHNKFKMSITNTRDEDPNGNNKNVWRRQPASHICKICNVSFSSGQALGMHKRSHKEDGKKKNEIDLNKLPNEVY